MLRADLALALDAAGVSYEELEHEHTETAADEAKALGLTAGDVAKTLVLSTPGGHLRAVLPASERIDMHKLRELLNLPGKRINLASEDELARDYPGFELGAVPPFGGPSDPVVVDGRVSEREWVVVEAGSHADSIRLRGADLVAVTNATVADICRD